MSDRCNFPRWLVQQGLRATPVRLAVLEILAEAPRALRAQEIMASIRTRRRVNHFELACEHHPPHPHFQCQTCREVQCLEPVALDRMWTELQGPVGNRADHIEIRIEGLCHKCREIS